MDTISKAEMNRIIKARGRTLKRTRTEIVNQIQYLANKYGMDSHQTIKVLLWSQGYSPSDSTEMARQICGGKT